MCLNDDGGRVVTTDNIYYIVIKFELSLGEGTLHETSLTIAQLAVDIVSPHVESTVIQSRHAMPLAAGNVSDMQWFLLAVQSIIYL